MVLPIAELRKLIRKDGDDEVWLNKLARRFSIYMTWFFLHIKGVTPTQITILGFIVGLMAAIFFATGDYYFGIYGAALVFLSYCIDNVDGEIARFKKLSSIEGHHMDALIGHLVDILFLFGIVIGSYIKTDTLSILILGLIMLFSYISYNLLVNLRYVTFNYYLYHYQNKLEKLKSKTVSISESNIKPLKFGSIRLKWLILFFSRFMFMFQSSFRFNLIFFLSAIGRLEYFIYLYGVIHPIFFLVNVVWTYYGGLRDFFDRIDHYVKTGEVKSFNS
ncbi:MAG: CDP-alcohol phosphatidyltransferase family protein [Candidatus Woesearchaeota archaeon]